MKKLPSTPISVNERLMTLRVPLRDNRHLTVLSVYAPTLNADKIYKDQFYGQLHEILYSVAANDKLVVMGDFNTGLDV